MPPPKDGKVPVEVVEIDSSSDDEGGGGGGATVQRSASISNNLPRSHPRPQLKVPKVEFGADVVSSGSGYRPLESRSFWKAGGYETVPSKLTNSQGDLEHARVHPRFLHSNATSHKWAFGAIAELLDNAVDEICNGATYVRVDRIYNKRDNSPALLFQDDGGGMDPEGIRKCMSLGYSSKTSKKTIGQYGNGFKTSTMRLGADVIVFSRACRSSQATQSIGLLSYTFLRRTGQDDVIVPMIDFDISDNWAEPIIHTCQDDWSANLKTILEWSPFKSKDDLLMQFEDMGSHGTKIIIYNLWLNDEGIYELNFDDDEEDIRLRDEANRGVLNKIQSHISYRIRYSLRAYASILYLRKFTNFKVIVRGKPVEHFSIADDLKHTEVITYKPQQVAALKEVTVETKIGFIKEAPALNVAGFNIYHKNRLVRPFWKVTADGSSKGHFVVGVLEANFIEPAHDKQDFERSILFFKLEMRLKQMVSDYWKGHCHLVGRQPDKSSQFYVPKDATLQPQVGVSRKVQLQQTGGTVNLTQSSYGLPASSLQGLDSKQIINQQSASYDNKLPRIQESGQGGIYEENEGFKSVDQICEENIQLFRRLCLAGESGSELRRMVQLGHSCSCDSRESEWPRRPRFG